MFFGRKKRGKQALAERKNMLLTTYLSNEFMHEQQTAELLYKTLSSWEDRTNGQFEFILDDPMAAAFRLKKDRDGTLRVSYYPTIPPGNPEREKRAQRLTEGVQRICGWFE